jgi:hypothetical protein
MTRKEILQGSEHLPTSELDALVSEFARLSVPGRGTASSKEESELFARIYNTVPEATWDRYEQLLKAETDERLTEEERAEMLRLGDEIEVQNADRFAALAELANVRGVTLRQLLADIGLPGPRQVG